jgi:hypothetical protein
MTEPHFAVLRPTGRVAYGHRERGETTNTQGMGRLRTWFSDEFTPDMPAARSAGLKGCGSRASQLAQQRVDLLGYPQPTARLVGLG